MWNVTTVTLNWSVAIVVGMLAYLATNSTVWAVGASVLTLVYSIWCYHLGAMAVKREVLKRAAEHLSVRKLLEELTREGESK